jgi:uncharacterized protein (DUF4415 family)
MDRRDVRDRRVFDRRHGDPAGDGLSGAERRREGRSPLRDHAKQQVTLRLDPDVLAKFREGGPGWQGRINTALRAAVGL